MSGEQQTQEPGTSMEGLDASLDDLMKAADADDLKEKLEKTYGTTHGGGSTSVEHSGHQEPGKGQVGGGQADYGDAGGLDSMMIGKMREAGVPESTINGFVAYMKGKQEDDEDDEDGEDEDEDVEVNVGKKGKAKKGEDEDYDFEKSFRDDPDIAESVDASPFMEALTARTVQSIETLNKSLRSSDKKQAKINKAMAAALYQQGQLVKSQERVISELGRRLGLVESQPAPPKGATSTSEAAAMSKAMPGEAGGPPAGGEKPLTKSEVVSTLSYMNLVKGLGEVGGEKTSDAVIKAESGGMLSKSVLTEVDRFLKSHPNEAEKAKSYR